MAIGSYTGSSLNLVPTQNNEPRGILFSPNGFRLFTAEFAEGEIRQYNLSAQNTISSADYMGDFLDVSLEESNPTGIAFSSDGMTLFVTGNSSDKIHQYDLIIPHDVTAATYSGNFLDTTLDGITPFDIAVSANNFTLFVFESNGKVHQYNFATANDITTATYSNNFLDTSSEATNPDGIAMSPDGFRLYLAEGNGSGKVFRYDFATANDITTAIYFGNFLDVLSESGVSSRVTLSVDGLILFLYDLDDTIYQYDIFPIPFIAENMTDAGEINENQFITLTFLKSFLKITDTQDDDTLLEIVKSSNNELKKQLKTVVDDITSIEGTKFFDRAQDTALTFALSKVRRNLNQMYAEADKLKANYTSEIETLLGDVRAIAPKRTSLQVVSRTIPFEDDYFAERHLP